MRTDLQRSSRSVSPFQGEGRGFEPLTTHHRIDELDRSAVTVHARPIRALLRGVRDGGSRGVDILDLRGIANHRVGGAHFEADAHRRKGMPERNVGWMSTRALTVCYRSASTGVEVVLVRSRRGSWTIPGGRINPGERPEQAAIRELREEAGVVGSGVAALVAHVLVLKNVGDILRPHASRSPVFLVRAQTSETTQEEWRTPTWFKPPDARVALAKHRIAWAARWRLAALDAAVATLER